MKFTPTTDEQQEKRSFDPFPAGEYDYEVDAAEEQISNNSGNEMVKLTLNVFNASGGKRVVFDYIVNTAAWKIKQFAASNDLLPKYETGTIEAYEMVGKTGRLKLKVESSEQYGDQNKVAFYIAAKKSDGFLPRSSKTQTSDDLSDEIPFRLCWE